jgi:hypothetical protein
MLMSMVDSYVRRKDWESSMLASKLSQALFGSGKKKKVQASQMLGMMGVNL